LLRFIDMVGALLAHFGLAWQPDRYWHKPFTQARPDAEQSVQAEPFVPHA
jgi:hypothetical protein